MSKEVLKANPVYADYLSAQARNHKLPVAGIILGMTRSYRPDTIVHMCRLFKSEDGDPEVVVDEEARKENVIYDVEDILHMLTPGIEVLGTFVVCKSDDVVKDSNAWDRVKLIYRVIRKLCDEDGVVASKHYVLVHNPTGSGKTSCKLVVGDKSNLDKNELKSVGVEFNDRNAYNLVQLNAQFSLTRSHFLRAFNWSDGERGQMRVTKLRELLCTGLENTLNTALITFNGEIPLEKQKIGDVHTGHADAGGDHQKGTPIVAEIYEKNVPIGDDEEVQRSSDLLQLKGCVASRLFVYSEDSLEYVESLLRKDLIKSITQRIQRATDIGSDYEGEGDGKEDVIRIHDLGDRMGRRIYFTIQPSNVQLFDYLYPDESEDELRERINSKLDIDVEVTDIYFDLEEDGQGAGDGTLTDTMATNISKTAQNKSPMGNRKILYLVIRFVLVAVVALVIPMVFNSKKDKK